MTRFASDSITLRKVVDSHDFRAVYQPCGPAQRLTAYLYGSLRADPASCLPFPLEGRHWVNYPWLCWPDQQGPRTAPGAAPDGKRYRSPAHACAASEGTNAAGAAPPQPAPAPPAPAGPGPVPTPPPTARSSPQEIAAAGAFAPATILQPLICQRTPQGLLLRFQLPPGCASAPLEHPWHFTVEALPKATASSSAGVATGGKAQGERQAVHIMTQPLCMLPASAFQRMMHEFRTGLSIHKTSAAGADEQVFVDFFIHYQHLHACVQPPDHLYAAGITRTWAGARYMHHTSRAPQPSTPVPTAAPAPQHTSGGADGSSSAVAADDGSGSMCGVDAGTNVGGSPDSGARSLHASDNVYIVENNAFEDFILPNHASQPLDGSLDGAEDGAEEATPCSECVSSQSCSTRDTPVDTDAELVRSSSGLAAQCDETGKVDLQNADTPPEGAAAAREEGSGEIRTNSETHKLKRCPESSHSAQQAQHGGPESSHSAQQAQHGGPESSHSAQQAQHGGPDPDHGPQGTGNPAEGCIPRQDRVGQDRAGGADACGPNHPAPPRMGLGRPWLPRHGPDGQPVGICGPAGRAPRLTTEAAWRRAESTAQHEDREQRMARLSAMSGAQQSRAMAAYLRHQMWLGCYLEPPMIGGDMFVALTLYRLPIRDGEAAVGPVVTAPTLAGAMLMAEGGLVFDLVRGSSWMGEIGVAGLIERGRLQADAPSPLSAEAQAAPRRDAEAAGGAAGQWVNLRDWWAAVSETFDGSLDSVAADVVLVHRSGRTVLGRVAGELWRGGHNEDLSYAEVSVPFIFDDQVVYGAIHLGGLPRFNIHPRVNSLTLMLGNYSADRLQL